MGDSNSDIKLKARLRSLPELFGAQEEIKGGKEKEPAKILIVDAGKIAGIRGHVWQVYLSWLLSFFLHLLFLLIGIFMPISVIVFFDLLFNASQGVAAGLVGFMFFQICLFFYIYSVTLEIDAQHGLFLTVYGRRLICKERSYFGSVTLFELYVDDIRGIQYSNRDLHILYGEQWKQIEFVEPRALASAIRRILLTAYGLTFSEDTLQKVMEALPSTAEEKGPAGRLLLKVGNRSLAVEVEDLDFEPSRRALGFGAAVECTKGRGHGRVARVTLFASGLVEGEQCQVLVNSKLGAACTAMTPSKKGALLNEISVAKLAVEGWRKTEQANVWTRGDELPQEAEEIVCRIGDNHDGVLVDLSSARAIAVISLSTPLAELAALTTSLGLLLDTVRREQSELPDGCELIAVENTSIKSEGQSIICRLCGVSINTTT